MPPLEQKRHARPPSVEAQGVLESNSIGSWTTERHPPDSQDNERGTRASSNRAHRLPWQIRARIPPFDDGGVPDPLPPHRHLRGLNDVSARQFTETDWWDWLTVPSHFLAGAGLLCVFCVATGAALLTAHRRRKVG